MRRASDRVGDLLLISSCARSALVTTGTDRTSWGGQSHSWVRPTKCPASPSSATMSVAAGRRETMRMPVTADRPATAGPVVSPGRRR